MTSDDFESALRKFRSDAAAETLRQAIRNLETKFDPNQPRAPVGSASGGQWVDTGRGGGGGGGKRLKPAKLGARPKARGLARAAGLLVSHPEAAPVAAAVALPVLAGGVALSRTIGEFDHLTTGREKTPFLKLPASKLRLAITAEDDDSSGAPRFHRGFFDPADKARVEEECDELEKNDYIQCDMFAATYGRTKKDKAKIWRACEATITERQAECRREGGASAVRTSLYSGRR